jgi:hypothetical protein
MLLKHFQKCPTPAVREAYVMHKKSDPKVAF